MDSVGQFLAAASDAPRLGYTFTVLDSPLVNAFAVPGGYVYLTRGLLALADSEAEVAGVLAHEIAHITARHGAGRQAKGTLAGLGLAILGAVTDSDALVNLGRVGAHAVLSAYSRKEEHEADEIGVVNLSRAGFDPGAMSSFLDKLKRHSEFEASVRGRSPRPGLDFFATHPRTRERVERAVAAARRTTVADPITARKIYLSKIDGLLFGDAPDHGGSSGNAGLLVILPGALAASTRHPIEIEYRGRIVSDKGSGVYFVADRQSWYPRSGKNKTHYELTFLYPSHLEVVATGSRFEDITRDGERISRFRSGKPIRIAGFNLGDYAAASREVNGFRVEVRATKTVEQTIAASSTSRRDSSPSSAGGA